jgi:hypothetical protein
MVDYYGRYLGSYQSSNSIKTRLIGSNPRTKRKAAAYSRTNGRVTTANKTFTETNGK